MRSRPMHTPCKLYVDFFDGKDRVKDGHFIRSNGGSCYLITAVRPHKTRPRRLNLSCLRWPPDELPPDAVVHPMTWYPRKRRARQLADLTPTG